MDDLHCSLCNQEYNSRQRLPRLFPNCGHTFCSSCIQKMIEMADDTLCCPDDKIECQFFNKDIGVGCFPLNFVLHKIIVQNPIKRTAIRTLHQVDKHIKNDESVNLNFCKEHSKICELVCYTDKKVICTDCALFGIHKCHQYVKMDDFKKEVKNKLTMLETKNESIKHKPFLYDGDKELSSLRQKIDIHKKKLRANIREYIQTVIEELHIRASELEETVEDKFSKFDYALSIIDNSAKNIKDKQLSIERTLSKIKTQIKLREFDYVFLMNNLYADNNAFTTMKDLVEELAELETTTHEVVDKELQKYTIIDDVHKAVGVAQESIDLRYCDMPCAMAAEDKKSDLVDESIDKETNIVTPYKNTEDRQIHDRNQDVSIAVSPDIHSKQIMDSKDLSIVSRIKSNYNKNKTLIKDDSASLLDIQIDEVDSDLLIIKPTFNHTLNDISTINNNATSIIYKEQTIKRNASFFRNELTSKQLNSQNTLNFSPDVIDKLNHHQPQLYSAQPFAIPGASIKKTEVINSLSNKKTLNEVSLYKKERQANLQYNPKNNSWIDESIVQDVYQLPRSSIRKPTLINKLVPMSSKQNAMSTDSEVNLSRMNITDNTLPEIINELLKNKKMKALNLSHNSITEIGFDQLLRKMATHPSLERIYMMNNYLDDSVFIKLEQRVKNLKKINYFNFQNCPQFKNMLKIKKYVASLVKYGIKIDV